MSSITKFVDFTLGWNIQWSDFDSIQDKPLGIQKDFVMAYNSVPFHWSARIQGLVVRNIFTMYYNEGPLEKIEGVEYEIDIVKPDGSFVVPTIKIKHSAKRGDSQCCRLFDSYSDLFRERYGLVDADRLVLQITVKIPIDVFSYSMPIPIPKPFAPWAVDLFNTINDPENSSFSDAKFISGDGIVFYCHKNVIAIQSEPLATMLHDPLMTQTEGDQNPPAAKTNESASLVMESQSKKKGEYPFPTMAAASLKSMVEYLYTGKATMVSLSVTELIEIADAAEQYALESLKKYCAAEMWKRVVVEPQEEVFKIAAFAKLHSYLHADMKWLKYRAFDVIMENSGGSMYDPVCSWRDMASRFDQFNGRFGGSLRYVLCHEFMLYSTHRLRPYIKP